ncbi:hypothetical protein ONZ45_g10559 [Pleurotus djamor]|nr:hypothetical protein ONZ45_g10559 [Pleurotus djamor]
MTFYAQTSSVSAIVIAVDADMVGVLSAPLLDATLSEDVEMKGEEEDMGMEIDKKDAFIVDVEMEDYQEDLEIKKTEVVYMRCVVDGKEEEGKTVLNVRTHTMREMEIAGVVVKDTLNRLGVAIHEHGDVSRLVKPKIVSVVSVAFESNVQINVEVNAGTFNSS